MAQKADDTAAQRHSEVRTKAPQQPRETGGEVEKAEEDEH